MNIPSNPMTRRRWMSLFAGAAASTLIPTGSRAEDDRKLLRVALSASALVTININDSRAAYKVWIDNMSQVEKQAFKARIVPEIIIPSEQILRNFRQGTLDCFAGTTLEYAKLIDCIDPATVLLENYLSYGIEYVLLVHAGSSFQTLADLQGRQMLSHLHRDMVLLPAWLGTMLAAGNLPAAEQFFGSLSPRDKLNQVMLPVYFRNTDGAFVTRRSWETAAELNPQLGRDLRPLAVSPKVIPLVMAFHRNCNPESRNALIEQMLHVPYAITADQMNALFQSSGFVARPGSVMKESVDLVREFARVSARQAR